MPRMARFVVPGVPHHVTQRGNRRQRTFFSDADYWLYLRIAGEAFRAAGVEIWAYCLMPNHVHLIAVPSTEPSLATAVSDTHKRYTRAINRREAWTGYLWQGRFGSFPMDDGHLMRCIRYVGLNPVRAGLVERALDWRWSSVRSHLTGRSDPLLTSDAVEGLVADEMPTFFDTDVEETALRELRRSNSTGRPLGAEPWVKALEAASGRTLAHPPMGRPRRGTGNGDTHDFRARQPSSG
jgi:putative transposase